MLKHFFHLSLMKINMYYIGKSLTRGHGFTILFISKWNLISINDLFCTFHYRKHKIELYYDCRYFLKFKSHSFIDHILVYYSFSLYKTILFYFMYNQIYSSYSFILVRETYTYLIYYVGIPVANTNMNQMIQITNCYTL